MKTLALLSVSALLAASVFGCGVKSSSDSLSSAEKQLIMTSPDVMYVLDVSDPDDEMILRAPSVDFSDEDLSSAEFASLSKKMLTTVQSPQQGGVGIAGPQVGLNRRVVVVCRTDKEGEPYIVYPNIKIVEFMGDKEPGPEGCLSVAPMRGTVERYQKIRIEYTDVNTLETVSETIEGYAAVIFQHECDHLDGILYTDRAETVYTNNSWELERQEFAQAGLYDKTSAVANYELERLNK